MKRGLFTVALPLFAITLFGCAGGGQSGQEPVTDPTDAKYSINVTPVEGSTQFPEAELQITGRKVTPIEGSDSVLFAVEYAVNGYELEKQTEDANASRLANSAQGQHVHYILDDLPYSAVYCHAHESKLSKESEHYLLLFLSRSYHESLKGANAYKLDHFSISASGELEELPLPEQPMLFYSRPKGEYVGKDCSPLLLDFYLINAQLAEDGYRVRADFDSDTTIVFSEWRPYQIEGLPMGSHTIKLTLIGPDGSPVSGPHTETSHTFTLREE